MRAGCDVCRGQNVACREREIVCHAWRQRQQGAAHNSDACIGNRHIGERSVAGVLHRKRISEGLADLGMTVAVFVG